MIAEIASVMQEEAVLADELKIIAGEPNGLKDKDREALRKSAGWLDEALASYARVYFRWQETEVQLVAARERLREANAALAKSNVFPTVSAKATIIGWRP